MGVFFGVALETALDPLLSEAYSGRVDVVVNANPIVTERYACEQQDG